VTDGELNASLPKGTTVEELTIDFALELLEERAKKAPRKKKASKKKSAKKKASKKKSAKKKATKKKASKKKS
jgi:DNA topoisomerase-1